MESVARTVDLPIKLELPMFSPAPLKPCILLGVGDIVLPTLFISFTRRFDEKKLLSIYYTTAVVGFAVGLGLTGVALLTTHKAQPALLYLVPCLLLPTIILAYCRNDYKDLWEGLREDDDFSGSLLLHDQPGDSGDYILDTGKL